MQPQRNRAIFVAQIKFAKQAQSTIANTGQHTADTQSEREREEEARKVENKLIPCQSPKPNTNNFETVSLFSI